MQPSVRLALPDRSHRASKMTSPFVGMGDEDDNKPGAYTYFGRIDGEKMRLPYLDFPSQSDATS